MSKSYPYINVNNAAKENMAQRRPHANFGI